MTLNRKMIRIVLTWQLHFPREPVNAREKVKDKRNKGSRRGHFGRHGTDEFGRGSMRWWGASNSRQGFDPFTNTVGDGQLDRDGCTIM